LMVVNLDAFNTIQTTIRIPVEHLGTTQIQVTDLITGNAYFWNQEWNFIELSPELPFHLFKIQR
jgi:starch synthase (maltosyl-transferring)